VEPELDAGLLNQVIGMGINENHAKHALHKTGNNSADMAVSWYFENMNDPCLNEPLRVKKEAKPAGDDIPQHLVEMVTAMGFSDKKAKKALKACVIYRLF
jgi:uncharacterized UBP type Zn finger protein